MDDAAGHFAQKLRGYEDSDSAKSWFSRNFDRIQVALSDGWVRDFIFEPIRGVFELQGSTSADQIRGCITRVAVANAVLAGLPGKMGVGVAVSMALEAWMAYTIASRIGIVVRQPSDIFKYFSLLAGVALSIIWLFKEILGVLFSLFSPIPGLNPLIPAELVATNLIGVLFWIGFEEATRTGSFKVPMRALFRVSAETKALYKFQWSILRHGLSPRNLRVMGQRFTTWLRGEIPMDKATLRGELFPTAAMAYLLAGEYERLDGPIGQEFLGAVRDRYPDLANASVEDIADHMSQYDAEELAGSINLIKGKLFERMVTNHENADGDEWQAVMHDDESYPGSDVVLQNEDGERIEVSLKATLNPDYIEGAWQQYPDIPVMGPKEMNEVFAGNALYMDSEISHDEVLRVTEENFDRLLNQLTPLDAAEIAAGGVATGAAIGLWPFVAAYLRKHISYEQLVQAFERVLGDAGKSLASRVSYGVVLGPVFAWYLLARGVVGVVSSAESAGKKAPRIAYVAQPQAIFAAS